MTRRAMSAKSLAKYPQASILRDIQPPPGGLRALKRAPARPAATRIGSRCLNYAKTPSSADG